MVGVGRGLCSASAVRCAPVRELLVANVCVRAAVVRGVVVSGKVGQALVAILCVFAGLFVAPDCCDDCDGPSLVCVCGGE